MTNKPVSTVFSVQGSEISQDEYVILPPTEMAKRETIGNRLKTARLALGMTVPELRRKIERNHRAEIGESTIRDIESDKIPNSGRKTIEFIALGVELDPLEVLALGLDDPPELEPGFKQSQFGQLWKAYSRLSKDERAVPDEFVQMLIDRINKRR